MDLITFVENHYPNYYSSDNIAKWNDLDKLLNDGGTDILERYHLTPLDIADGTVKRIHDDLELVILKECIKNISLAESIEMEAMGDDSLPF